MPPVDGPHKARHIGAINTPPISKDEDMETHEADDDVTAHRARTIETLDQITQKAKLALIEQGIDLPLFFIVPHSGDALLTFGTITDPPDVLWDRVGEIVSSVVRQSVGLERTRCRPVVCATTESAADHQTARRSMRQGHSAAASADAHFRSQTMRYRDITSDVGNRCRLPPSHPILARISIDPVDWQNLQRLNADNPATQIVGHDEPHDGQMTVYIACASEEVQRRMEDGWG
jgi:hypothetical protein